MLSFCGPGEAFSKSIFPSQLCYTKSYSGELIYFCRFPVIASQDCQICFYPSPVLTLTTQSWHRLHRLKVKSSTWLSSLQMLDMSLGRSLDHILFCPTSYEFGGSMTFPLAQWVKNPIAMQETQGMRLWSLGEEMATHYTDRGAPRATVHRSKVWPVSFKELQRICHHWAHIW